MAQLVVRNLDERVKARLKLRARRHGRSTEEEVRQILRSAVKEVPPPRIGLGTRIASRFSDGLREDVEELRGEPARPAELGR